MSDKALHGADDVHAAASSIFDSLPEDPFGDGADEEATGKSPVQEADVEDRSTEEDAEDFDAEATEALTDEEDEEDESGDEEEVEGEEDDAAEEEEGSEDDEDEGESGDAGDPTVTVRVNGEDVEIALSEALAGYSRTASWTQKSQKLADERKAFEAEQVAVRQDREAYGVRLQSLEEQLGASLPQEPSPDDPQAWIRYQQAREQLGAVQRERADLHQRMEAERQTARKAQIAAENAKLVEIIPEWRDGAVAMSAKTSLAKYAVSLGFDEDAVDSIVDHRLVLLLRKGQAYDAMDEAKGDVRKKTKKAPVLKPGQVNRRSSSKTRKARRKAASKRDILRKTGSVDAAADFIYESLDDED